LTALCLEREGRAGAEAERIAAAVLSAIEGAYMLSGAAPGVLPSGYAAPSLASMLDGLLDAQPLKENKEKKKRRTRSSG
jgi:TetR/AcrR family transcriptional repressor of bet genes